MSLFIALGSNLGDSISTLALGFKELCSHLKPIALSRVYYSKAIGYLDQPDFYNQVAEFETPSLNPEETLQLLLQCEANLGRVREISMGPRTLDLDLLFYDFMRLDSSSLTLPHPRLWTRSFVVLPLQELPGYKTLSLHFNFDHELQGEAVALENTSTLFF